MKEPWEIFWQVCVEHGMGSGRGRRGAAPVVNAAQGISTAAEVTIKHLRNHCEWTWVNSRIMAGKLVDVAADWLLCGARDPEVLRSRLRETWQEEQEVAKAEAKWRAVTESVMAGSGAIDQSEWAA
jgi:hypothetical protein